MKNEGLWFRIDEDDQIIKCLGIMSLLIVDYSGQ